MSEDLGNLLARLKDQMNYSLERHGVLAGNVSRANMPGEKAFDLALSQASNNVTMKKVQLSVTRAGHMLGNHGNNYKVISMADADGINLNGNNISLEQQMIKINENNAEFLLANNAYKQVVQLMQIPLSIE